MSAKNLPSLEDISPTKGLDLDEKCAVEHFLGKSIDEASLLFKENAFYYGDDLMHMGRIAFAFYLPALKPYLESSESEFDSDIVNHLLGTIRARLEFDAKSICLAKSSILELLGYCLDKYPKFQVDVSIYGDLGKELRGVLKEVELLTC